MLHVENATKHSFLASPQKHALFFWIGGRKQRANCDTSGEQDRVWDSELKVSFSWGIFELFSEDVIAPAQKVLTERYSTQHCTLRQNRWLSVFVLRV